MRQHQNWPEHFKEPLRESLARLGIRVTMISQTQMYTSGSCTAVRVGRPYQDRVHSLITLLQRPQQAAPAPAPP